MRWLRCVAMVVVVATSFVGLTTVPARAATLDVAEVDLVQRINDFRASKGLAPLAVSDTLTGAAKWMAADMSSQNYFSHTSLDGRNPTQRMADAGYPAYQTWTGEDLAAGYATAAEALIGWINSPAHYAVLTNPVYRAIGVGRSYGPSSTYQWYWAADFGGMVDAVAPAASGDLGFHSAWAGQSPDPVVGPGEVATLVVALQNAGSRGWSVGTGQEARIGTSAPIDVDRSDLAYGWIAPNRPTTTTTAYVGPGQVGWFQFRVRAPSSPGSYRLSLRGVIEGQTWMEDQGIYFTITVR